MPASAVLSLPLMPLANCTDFGRGYMEHTTSKLHGAADSLLATWSTDRRIDDKADIRRERRRLLQLRGEGVLPLLVPGWRWSPMHS
jgi:hypothetical protein